MSVDITSLVEVMKVMMIIIAIPITKAIGVTDAIIFTNPGSGSLPCSPKFLWHLS